MQKILENGSRLHRHSDKEKYPHVDNIAPSISKRKHLIKDFFGCTKGASVLKRWTQRKRRINGKNRLVAIRKLNGKIQIRFLNRKTF